MDVWRMAAPGGFPVLRVLLFGGVSDGEYVLNTQVLCTWVDTVRKGICVLCHCVL